LFKKTGEEQAWLGSNFHAVDKVLFSGIINYVSADVPRTKQDVFIILSIPLYT
jgi:hypothetical protein